MLLADGSVRRPKALRAAGIRPQAIADALRAGQVAKTQEGAYFVPGAEPRRDLVDLAGACTRMPRAVVCLLSAAHLSGLVDEAPPKLWLALPQGVHATTVGDTPRHVLRWSYEGAFEVGVIEDEVCGVAIRRTNAVRTVVDLLRYSKHVGGIGAGIHAARRYVATGGRATDFLVVAETLQVPSSTMRDLQVAAAAIGGGG
ncbi:type IV toxin-antitoxin system AbiEi family antitoxin domain-containing protein [Muricoccus radiodurans]|uniref:type IV toxin-antitoxin system AbiEi family antitoxin domain-containing protein n=1 Tax=Muricoccus radiodurans TaxID=2231721 RepID=UPI003CF0ECE5